MAEGSVAVGVESGEFVGDVDGVDAVEVDVFVVAWPDMPEVRGFDRMAGEFELSGGSGVVLGGPHDDGVRDQGEGPHLLGVIVVIVATQGSLTRERNGAP